MVILGGKYDKFQVIKSEYLYNEKKNKNRFLIIYFFQDFEPEKKKIICRSLRYVAHTLGASLQFYSLYDIALVKKTKDMLRHLAFGSAPVYV